jgi:hypothetical protein
LRDTDGKKNNYSSTLIWSKCFRCDRYSRPWRFLLRIYRGIHTVAVYGDNLSGRIIIQGTLATTPTEDDWFNILIGGLPYKDYTSFTGVEGFTFIANLVFLRAKLDRTALGISNFATAGHVGKIYLNY